MYLVRRGWPYFHRPYDTFAGRITADLAAPFANTSLSATVYQDDVDAISIGFIETSLSSAMGWGISAGFLTPALASIVTVTESISASLSSFTSTLSASMTMGGVISANIGFISSTLSMHGGANVAFSSPTLSFSASVTVESNRINAALSFPLPTLHASGTMEQRMSVSVGFIDTALSYWTCNLAGPLFSLSSSVSDATSNAIAYVMNVHTQESTTYSNFGFLHIINIGGKPYGVKSDGLYLLEGATDTGININGTVTTKETDFGVFESKRVPTVYLNSDTLTTVTPTVDSTTYSAYSSTFGGRKTLIARGIEGRYWRFKIDAIQQLEGVEFLPENRQRRVK